MEPMTLEEAKAEKIREVREFTELAYWDVFVTHPDDIPILAMGYITLGSVLGGQLTQVSREKATEARAVVDQGRTLCDQVRAATTLAEVAAVPVPTVSLQAAEASGGNGKR